MPDPSLTLRVVLFQPYPSPLSALPPLRYFPSGKRKQGKVVNQIWVIGAGGDARAPTEDEHRRAMLKEKAPQLMPRIKRNW